ncbi:MAG: polysaccharide biosynthesis tyrosine autokinase [Acidimicrobiia bacterium]|nr:polysaccharide biosynthesis tyrosine autokinase [Acidimicrobiia bacterium]
MQDSHGGSDLRTYLRVLRRRKFYVILAVIAVAASALAVSLVQHKVYQGTAALLLAPNDAESLFVDANNQQVAQSPAAAVQTQIELIQSAPVANEVRQRIGSAPSISVSQVGQTQVVHLTASSTSPAAAAKVANTYAQSYIDVRRTQALDDLGAAGAQVQGKIGDLQKQIDAIPVTGNPPRSADPAMENQREALINQQSVYRQRLDQIQLQAGLDSGGAQLVTPAAVPTSPVSPKPVRNGLLGLLGGLVIGIAMAFLFEQLDDSVKTKDDVDRALHAGVPTLGIIPAIEGWRSGESPRVVSIEEPTSASSEAYRSLRTAIGFLGLDRPLRVIQVTSPSAAEGKTTTIANLAVALANIGKRVVVVDCDLRRPRIHAFFDIPSEVGFTSVLLGDVALGDAARPVGRRHIMLLPSGPLPPNPSELLSSARAGQVLRTLQAEADVVLVDSPPVLPVTDSAVLSAHVDATLLVVRAGVTTRRQLARSVEVLEQVAAPLVGLVLNGVTAEDEYGYPYRYGYYGAHDSHEQSRTADRI